jgi:predicted P-loop ATPase
MDETIKQVVERWNADHRADYPTRPGTCPACQHNDCFHALPKDPTKWFCFSSGHSGVGIAATDSVGHYGDALDLEAYARGCKPVDVLRADGYLSTPRRPPPRSQSSAEPQPDPIEEPEVIPITTPSETFRPWRSRSYLTAVEILRKNARDVLEGRQLELNEMSGRPEIGRLPLRDSDVSRIRGLVEARFTGGLDKNNNEVGMVLGREDLRDAVDQVASENPYHPVRHYLRNLAWDGVERIGSIPEDVLGADRTELNQAMMRRWFVSAVARALKAGCKVDTVFILVGLQGVRKSTFFKTLADPWFIDSSVDIHNKDSFQVLRGAWIYEWAELEVLRRARDATAAKAFLSSAVDTYRPSHARYVVDVPRSCVIVGSTNERDFLTDSTGNRRFWPLDARRVDIEILAQQRDQLWAEAVARFDRGEQWWFDAGETAALEYLHEHYHAADSWDETVIAFDPSDDFTTGDVLRHALKKEIGTWSKPDEMRVARILRRHGWEQVKITGKRVWRKR